MEWGYLLPSSSSLCSPHNADKSYRQCVKAKNNDFIWKPGRLMSQNNHLIGVWMPGSFIEYRGEEVRK